NPNETTSPDGSEKPPRMPSRRAGSTGTQPWGRAGPAAAPGAGQPIAASASKIVTATCQPSRRAVVFMSDVPRSTPVHDHVLQALALDRARQGRQRRGAPVARMVEGRELAAVVHHEQHPVVPQPVEVAARQ